MSFLMKACVLQEQEGKGKKEIEQGPLEQKRHTFEVEHGAADGGGKDTTSTPAGAVQNISCSA